MSPPDFKGSSVRYSCMHKSFHMFSNRWPVAFAFVLAVSFAAAAPFLAWPALASESGYVPGGYNLVFSDEFADGAISTDRWMKTNPYGVDRLSANGEDEHYTSDGSNHVMSGNGSLALRGKNDDADSASNYYGSAALKLVATASPSYGGPNQTVTVTPNTNYVFKASLKGHGQKFRFAVTGAAWNLITPLDEYAYATSDWTEASTSTFNSGSNTVMHIQLQEHTNVAGAVYIDNAFFGVEGGVNLLTNGDFENSSTSWGGLTGKWAITNGETVVPYAGSAALKLVATNTAVWAGPFQNITVAPSTDYIFKARIKGSGQNVRWTVLAGSSWSTVLLQQNTATTEWTEVNTPVFNSGSNTVMHIQLQDSGTTPGSLFIDEAFFGVEGGANLLTNGGFESGWNGWLLGTNQGSRWSIPGSCLYELGNCTSAWITAKSHFRYGYFESRAKINSITQGIWPAYWLYGVTASPREWDIFEFINSPNTVYQTPHFHGNDTYDCHGSVSDRPFNDAGQYHIYGFLWTDTEIKWYVDGVETRRCNVTMDDPDHSWMWLYHNLSLGGNWPGRTNANTAWPAEYSIDYTRVYQNANGAVTVNGVTELVDPQSLPGSQEGASNQRAKIDFWKASLFKTKTQCPTRLKLAISGKHFHDDIKVMLGDEKALSVDVKSSKKLVASFCLNKFLKKNQKINKKAITVKNPGTKTVKAKKEIDFSIFTKSPERVISPR